MLKEEHLNGYRPPIPGSIVSGEATLEEPQPVETHRCPICFKKSVKTNETFLSTIFREAKRLHEDSRSIEIACAGRYVPTVKVVDKASWDTFAVPHVKPSCT